MNEKVSEQDFELLSQLLDGELEPEQAREVSARLLAEPALRKVYERMKSSDSRLRAAFDAAGADAVPAQVAQMVQTAATRDRKRLGWSLGVAASVLFAAGVVINTDQPGEGVPQFAAQDALVAPVLERAPSRGDGWETLPDGSQVRPLLSFSGLEGDWCREYLLAHEGQEWRGVACRASGQWVTAVLAAEAHTGEGGYRPAGAATPGEVAAFIDRSAADIPLSREQEAALIARGWR